MRGCTCRGLTLCAWCTALAERAVGSGVPGSRGLGGGDTPGIARLPLSEKAFMSAVLRVAKQHDWLCYHTHDSRKSAPGYPDVTLARLPGPGRPGEVIWAELKVEAPLTIEQERWLATLSHVQHTEAHLWRPADMPVILARLSR